MDIGKMNFSFVLNAKKTFGFSIPIHLPPLTKLNNYIGFQGAYGLIEGAFVFNRSHRLSDEEYASIYLSDIGKQLVFNVEEFDKTLAIPELDEIKFFKQVKNIYYKDKRSKKLDSVVYRHYSSITGESEKHISGKFVRTLGVSQLFLAACNALRFDRDSISFEDLLLI